jgi:hypothetical protein
LSGARDEDSAAEALRGPDVCPRAEITSAIHQRCTRDLRRKRQRTVTQRSLSSVALAMLVVSLFFASVFSMHRGVAVLSAPVIVVCGSLHAGALFLLLGTRAVSGRSVIVRLTLACVVPLSFFTILALTANSWRPAMDYVSDVASRARATRCAAEALLVGALAGAGILLSWYRTDPFTPGLSGWIAGLTAGIVGSTAAASLCSDATAFHLALGHGLVVILLGVTGWAIGRRVLSP